RRRDEGLRRREQEVESLEQLCGLLAEGLTDALGLGDLRVGDREAELAQLPRDVGAVLVGVVREQSLVHLGDLAEEHGHVTLRVRERDALAAREERGGVLDAGAYPRLRLACPRERDTQVAE